MIIWAAFVLRLGKALSNGLGIRAQSCKGAALPRHPVPTLRSGTGRKAAVGCWTHPLAKPPYFRGRTKIGCHPLSHPIKAVRKKVCRVLSLIFWWMVERAARGFLALFVSCTAVLSTSCFNPEELICCFAEDVQEVKLAKSKCQMDSSYLLSEARSEDDEKAINLYGLRKLSCQYNSLV